MKHVTLSTILLLAFSINCFAQFGADYSSYGFNFVNDTHNDGLKGWVGAEIGNTSKLNIYRQDATMNNYALEMKAQNQTIEISYDDTGYMDMNPCSLVIILRLNLTQYTGNQDRFSFKLQTGAKLLDIQFQNDGIYYLDNSNNTTLITTAPVANQWFTYTISLDACGGMGGLMIENDVANIFPLSFPNDTSTPSIALSTSTNGNTEFEAEVDHLFIYSNPIKWWLVPSTTFVDDTPAGYQNTTGDRQHFLCLPNGERIGVNENGGGYVTFTELFPGGPNLDPRPKFGSGGTKTLRGYFHTSNFNPVQAGISSTSGGHLVDVNVTPDKNKVSIDTFPLHSYFQDDFIENTPLVYPDGTILGDENHPAIIDDDVYDEFGLDMRHELMSELDFNTCLENITRCGEISTVKHSAEWEYIRHPAHILQFHEVAENQRPKIDRFPGVNNDMRGDDTDMGEMRHKFEFRLNYDLGYKYVLWRDASNTWQSIELMNIGENKSITIERNTAKEQRFLVFSTSPDPDVAGAVSWYYPESDVNINGTLGKSRSTKDIMYTEDRRTSIIITADWRKTNWCRMNLYVRNEGLIAPPNGDPTIYEAFQFEAHQLFGTPNEILNEVLICEEPIRIADVTGGTFCEGTTANFSFSGTPNTIVTYNINGGANTTDTLDATGVDTVVASNTAGTILNLVSIADLDAPDCTEPLTGSAEVIILDAPTAALGNDTTICFGNSVNLSAIRGGSATTVYWSSDAAATGTIATSPGDNITYTPTGVVAVGRMDTLFVTTDTIAPCAAGVDTLIVSVVNAPTVALGNDTTLCEGSSVMLTGSIGGSGTQIYWTAANGSFNTNPSATITYTPTGLVAAGRMDTLFVTTDTIAPCAAGIDTLIVSVINAPTVALGNDTTICFGNSVNLSAVRGGSATTVYWSSDAAATGTIATSPGDNITYTPTGVVAVGRMDTLFVTTDTIAPCAAGMDTLIVSVINAPTVALGNDTTLCEGSSVMLTGSIGGSGTKIYWTAANGSVNTNPSATITYTPNALGVVNTRMDTLFVTTDTIGSCNAGIDTLIVTISQNSTVTSIDSTVCIGDSLNLTAIRGGGANRVYWTTAPSANGVITTSPNDVINYKPLGVVTVGRMDTLFLTTDTIVGCPGLDTVVITVTNLTTQAPPAVVSSESNCVNIAWGLFNFGPFNWGGGIAPPATTCPPGSTVEYATDGTNFSTTLPAYTPGVPKTITTRCECGGNTSPTNMITTIPNTSCSNWTIRFSDPCNCANPKNCNVNGVQYNHDTLKIEMIGGLPLPIGLTVTLASASDFTADVPCNGAAGVVEHVPGNVFTETAPGVYEIEFWKRDNGNLPTVNISIDGVGSIPVPMDTFEGHLDCGCDSPPMAATEPIPTMSEWGLLIFGLLILNLFIGALHRKEMVCK